MTQAVPWPRPRHDVGCAMTHAVPLPRRCHDAGCALTQAVSWPSLCHDPGRAMTQAAPWPRLCHDPWWAITQALPWPRLCHDAGCALTQAVSWPSLCHELGRAMTHAMPWLRALVSGPFTIKAWVWSQVIPCDICGTVSLWQVSVLVLRYFPCRLSYTQRYIIFHSSPGADTKGPLASAVWRDLVTPSPPNNKKKNVQNRIYTCLILHSSKRLVLYVCMSKSCWIRRLGPTVTLRCYGEISGTKYHRNGWTCRVVRTVVPHTKSANTARKTPLKMDRWGPKHVELTYVMNKLTH